MSPVSDLNRRQMLKRAAALGVLAGPAAGVLSACATSGGNTQSSKGKTSNVNPLGVKADAPLEVVIFNGGFGDQYAKDAEAVYKKKYPQAQVNHSATQQISQTLQPRFVNGNPPDVIDNSGAQELDTATLAANGQLEDLTPLLDAASLDDPNKKVRDTLVKGTIEQGQFGTDPKVYALNYAFTVYGVWYSQSLLDKHGWKYPKTWDDMIKLCGEIKKAGIAPWTYAGKFPYYVHFAMYAMIAKIGGVKVIKAIDNLEPNAWKNDAVKEAVNAFGELAARGYVMQGSEGLTHIESQTAWTEGKAVFIPNGSWVENEAKKTTPADFKLGVAPVPSGSKKDKMPFETVWAAAGEPFVVPKQAKNSVGGMEFLRVMLGKASAQNFTKLVSSLTSVQGAAEGLTLPSGLTAASKVLKAAGDNVVSPKIVGWYKDLEKNHIGQATGLLMSGRIKADEWVTRVQAAADAVAKDSSIKKYKEK